MGGLGTVHPTAHGLTAGIVATIPALRPRDMSQGSEAVVNVVISFAVDFSTPYLQYAPRADLGPKSGFIFSTIALLPCVFTYLCVPECKGKSLEEIDLLFSSDNPLRHFDLHQMTAGLDESEEEGIKDEAFSVKSK
ncbi:hypothetical protein N7449_005174 [Penicillium cf. viridicatum]|uniref:Major facilitator superfamily (MFS) profile domain-containing protein n=1 Tax=Penicillium cf. viridicatum TaxID=2972119 RepID=A0A9W9MKX8_9EURO|nr:hypothetical protein N7449_005174 [Penicillium cf. viridicatum]